MWYQNKGETLGLAMSRSLGDAIVHRSGVSAEPETLEHIDEYDEFMIIATDGVWDVIDNNQAVQMVQNFSSKSQKWSALDASNISASLHDHAGRSSAPWSMTSHALWSSSGAKRV